MEPRRIQNHDIVSHIRLRATPYFKILKRAATGIQLRIARGWRRMPTLWTAAGDVATSVRLWHISTVLGVRWFCTGLLCTCNRVVVALGWLYLQVCIGSLGWRLPASLSWLSQVGTYILLNAALKQLNKVLHLGMSDDLILALILMTSGCLLTATAI